MCQQTLVYSVKQTQKTVLDADIYVWIFETTVSSMGQANEKSAQQEPSKTYRIISNNKRAGPRNTRQNFNRQGTGRIVRGVWKKKLT